MSKSNKIIIVAVALLAALLLFWNWQIVQKQAQNTGNIEQEKVAEKLTINLLVEGLEGLPTTVEFKSGGLLLDVLKEFNQKYPALNLQTKDFGQMGVLVEQMGSQKNGTDGKYWQYFVNGAQPMVGADKYVLQSNDRVEWKFAKSEF